MYYLKVRAAELLPEQEVNVNTAVALFGTLVVALCFVNFFKICLQEKTHGIEPANRFHQLAKKDIQSMQLLAMDLLVPVNDVSLPGFPLVPDKDPLKKTKSLCRGRDRIISKTSAAGLLKSYQPD